MSWRIVIRLESEAIFSSGEAVPAEADLDIMRDEHGFPCYGARRLKGMWREQTEFAARALSGGPGNEGLYTELRQIIDHCFGRGGLDGAVEGKLRLTDAVVPHEVRKPFLEAIRKGELHPQEVFESMTAIRYFTSIDAETGTVQPGSLRQFRVLLGGVELVSDVYGLDELQDREIGLLTCGLAGWRYAGVMKHRGKGHIRVSLWKDGENVTKRYLEAARKWVTAS